MSKSVLTLIVPPGKEKLSDALVAAVTGRLKKAGAQLLATDWLASHIACDIIFTHIEPHAADSFAREVIESAAIDCIAQEAADRQKRMLIADMDSTIITVECIDEIADFAGVKKQVAEITERAMRGEIEFTAALAERVGLLKGLKETVLQTVYEQRVQLMPGARALVATMRANGAYTILVSGGFDFFTSRIRNEIKFHADMSNKLEIKAGALTGNVIPPILDKQAKLAALMQVSSAQNINTSQVLAVGDGANDVPMLVAAGLGVAYHAKPVVQQAARARINHCDLTALLYAQGYRQEEIVNA